MGVMRKIETAAASTAEALWPIVRRSLDRRPAEGFQPDWAPAKLQKGAEMNRPQLGWPRDTDSLCPGCVVEARTRILAGETTWKVLLDETPGEIRATIRERDGKIVMEKSCPKHGDFTDVLANDPAFLERIESLHPGGDFTTPVTPLRNHGKSTIKYGRGSVLVIDLTNRCNMMCDACFMDANQVGYVHELTLDDVKKILDDAAAVKPRRQMSINFSGGEPTISPIFLDAVRYAREVGYFAVQCSTNGVRFAQEPEFAFVAKEAGLRFAYLQFDGTDNESHEHRRVSNLFDVKQKAIDNLAAAEIDVVLVPTILKGVNDHQVGKIVNFAIENADKVSVVSFQPVSFTGRDENIDEDTRRARRYTLSDLAQDVTDQTGMSNPHRDWFPLSALGPFSDVVDLLLGKDAPWGSLKCGCHPNCGVGTGFLVHKRTKEAIPLSDVINLDQIMADMRAIADNARGNKVTIAQMGLSLLRNFNAEKSPLPFTTVMRHLMSHTGAGDFAGEDDEDSFEWRILFVAGMWFQDLWNYDFRRTERCIIPYGTQMGEISFCAYNTGVGWRQIVEDMHRVASTQEWFETKGRHKIFAGHRPIPLLSEAAEKEGGCGSSCGCGPEESAESPPQAVSAVAAANND